MQELSNTVLTAARAAGEGRTGDATRHVDEVLGRVEMPRDMLEYIFASAIGRRVGHRPATENLYLRELDLAQIALFNLLATHLPMVIQSGRLANELIAGFLAHSERPVLLDLGVGTAQQEVALLRTLKERAVLPKRMTVVAVEPGPTSLEEATRTLQSTGSELGVQIDVVGFAKVGEALTDGDWARIAAIEGDLVVNSAFAAHHVQSTGAGPGAARDELFRRIRELNPRLFVLLEPNADHINPGFGERFAACWRHFGTLFAFVDQLDVGDRDKAAIKLFFSREIDDIVANSEQLRAERHETASSWLSRLERTGFSPAARFPFDSPAEIGGMWIRDGGGHRGLGFGDELLVAVIAATTTASGDPVAAGWRDTGAARSSGSTIASVPAAVSSFATGPGAARRVRDIMSQEVVTVPEQATLRDAARIVHQTGASDLVVVDDRGAMRGVLSEGDLLRTLMPKTDATQTDSLLEAFELLSIKGRTRAPDRIGSLVITEALVLSPGDDLLKVAHIMISRQIRRLPVVEDGRAVGTVSRADLCHALLGEG